MTFVTVCSNCILKLENKLRDGITCLRKFRKRLRLVSENDLHPRKDADPLTWEGERSGLYTIKYRYIRGVFDPRKI